MTAWQKTFNDFPLRPEIGIVTLVPDKWCGPWSTRQYLMNRLASYFPIVWVEPAVGWRESLMHFAQSKPDNGAPCTEPAEAILVHNPRWLPKLYKPRTIAKLFDRKRLLDAANLLRRQGCQRIVLYIWRPEFAPAIDLMPHDVSFYHIDDEYTFSESEKQIEAQEEQLIRRADQVIIHSPALLEKKGHINPHTMFVPNGVEFMAYASSQPEPTDIRDIPHPRIGYTGVIKMQLDFLLLIELARRHREWSFVFVGPRGNISGNESLLAELERMPNVYMLGGRPADELPAYVQHFDVGILCYLVNDYTKYIYPLKMHEYLACGLPVVGSPIRTLEDFRHIVTLARGADEWSRALAASLEPSAVTIESIRIRQEVARGFDWRNHAATIALTICERLETNWVELNSQQDRPGLQDIGKEIPTTPLR